MNRVSTVLLLSTSLVATSGASVWADGADPVPPPALSLEIDTFRHAGRDAADGEFPSAGLADARENPPSIEERPPGEMTFEVRDEHGSEDWNWHDETPLYDFATPEFKASNAVGQVNALAAYARGSTGSSVTVAVVDEAFDLDHPDLAPNIVDFQDFGAADRRAGQGADATERTLFELGNKTLVKGHGTLVAGVVAAARNRQGIHGIAPDASLLALRTDSLIFEEIRAEDLGDNPVDELIEGLKQGTTLFVAEGTRWEFSSRKARRIWTRSWPGCSQATSDFGPVPAISVRRTRLGRSTTLRPTAPTSSISASAAAPKLNLKTAKPF